MLDASFRAAIEAAPSAMVIVDHAGWIVMANTQTEEMFGYGRAELIGRPVESLIPERSRADHVCRRREFQQSPQLRPMGRGLDLFGHRSDGFEFPVDVRLSPIDTPGGRFVLAAVVDVTERKRLEESLREQVRQREQFLAMLSHELRNPLGAVLSAASVLLRYGEQNADAAAACGVIGRQAAQMATLLDDLLDASRLTQGKIALRRAVWDLRQLAREAIESVAASAAQREHSLELGDGDRPLWVHADRTRVLQILTNLLTNAVRYTPPGGEIRVALTGEEGDALVSVRDNGLGISADQLGRIFDMFVQGDDSLDRPDGGMGVGLTLVRSLAEMHGGGVTARSDGTGRGSEFTLRLPMTDLRPEAARLPEPAGESGPFRIVLVEDNADSREMLQQLLKFEGHSVEVAGDGERGLELIEEVRPDVALLDIGLPGMDGYELARRLREHFGRLGPRLIALTGYGGGEDRRAVREAGFDEHLVKPVRMGELQAAMERVRGGVPVASREPEAEPAELPAHG